MIQRWSALLGFAMMFLCISSCQTPISPENSGTSSPNFTWAVQYGTRGPDGMAVVNLDAGGNILVAGYQQIYTSDISTFSAGWNDAAFVAQYSPSGALRWARRVNSSTLQRDIVYGNPSGTIWRGVASDAENNVYLVGEFLSIPSVRTASVLPRVVAAIFFWQNTPPMARCSGCSASAANSTMLPLRLPSIVPERSL